MGSLAIGKILLSLVGISLKATKLATKAAYGTAKAAAKVAPHISPVVRQVVQTFKSQVAVPATATLARHEIKQIYQQQKQKIDKHLDVPAQTPYVVAATTALGGYLSEEDWLALSSNRLGETELLKRVETNYDNEVHARLQRAVQTAGFVNVRRQLKAGPKQVASYSDGTGHGVRIALNHQGESQIGVDLIGYDGGECESKREELLEAMAAEGITVRDIRTIPHHDPKGYQAREESTPKRRRSRVRPSQRQQQRR